MTNPEQGQTPPEILDLPVGIDAGGTRRETDAMGAVDVPADRYWGAQTQRSLEHFTVGDDRMPPGDPPRLRIRQDGRRAGQRRGRAAAALDGRSDRPGRRRGDRRRARRALPALRLADRLGHADQHERQRGHQQPRDPAGSAARSAARRRSTPTTTSTSAQSSNDSFPTAIHVAAVLALQNHVLPELRNLHAALDAKARRVGRHPQDRPHPPAGRRPAHRRPGVVRLRRADRRRDRPPGVGRWPGLYELAAGGTAVGTGLNAPPGFAERFAAELAELTGQPFVTAPNKFAALAGAEAMVAASAGLRGVAVPLLKIANDIRFLGSGPRNGLGELRLPGERAGQLDHARQGQPDAVRGHDDGLPEGDRPTTPPLATAAGHGQLRAQHHAPPDRLLLPALRPHPHRRRPQPAASSASRAPNSTASASTTTSAAP